MHSLIQKYVHLACVSSVQACAGASKLAVCKRPRVQVHVYTAAEGLYIVLMPASGLHFVVTGISSCIRARYFFKVVSFLRQVCRGPTDDMCTYMSVHSVCKLQLATITVVCIFMLLNAGIRSLHISPWKMFIYAMVRPDVWQSLCMHLRLF